MSLRRIDAERVRAILSEDVVSVLNHFGIKHEGTRAERRFHLCPRCGHRTNPSVAINTRSGLWQCWVCRSGGDILDLIAGYAGLDVRRDFPQTLALGAQIAGLSPGEGDPERDRRMAEHRRVADDRRRREDDRRKGERAKMSERYNALARRSPFGEAYLRERGLDPDALHHVVRYTVSGAPALPLRDLSTGAVVGIQSRRSDRKHTEYGSQVKGAALAGRLTDLDPEGVDVAVLVEGLTDTLAAHLQWSGCAIFGAPGASQLPAIAATVAPRVVEVRGWMLVVPDVDGGNGEKATAAAVRAAIKAGLVLDKSVHLVDVRPSKDLADAVRAGWKWSWPS